MRRRTTLGPISSSQENQREHALSRQSMGMSNVGGIMGAQRVASKRQSMATGAPPRPRQSLLPRPSGIGLPPSSSTSRRSSTFGTRATRADPRPNADKAYMNQCIRFLIKFLSEHQYDHAISPKMLSRPMKKDFASIVSFLFRIVDPNFRFSEKIEDDVTTMYRQLRYPFSISKTALVAVGSPHTWPSLLASLTWLVDLLMYDEIRQEQARDVEGESQSKIFFAYLSKGYNTYMNGEDDYWFSLEKKILDQMTSQQGDLQAEIDDIASQNELLKQEIKGLRNAQSSLPELNSRKKDYIGDLKKFENLVGQLEVHKARLGDKLKNLQTDLDAKEMELKGSRTEIKSLKSRIERQELSSADVEHMSNRHNQLKDQVRQTTERKDEIQRGIWDTEREIEEHMSNLEQKLEQFRNIATEVRLIPDGSKNSMGRTFQLEIDTDKTNACGLLTFNISLKSHIRPGLMALKKNRIDRTNAAWDRALELQSDIDHLNGKLVDAESKKEEIEIQLQRLRDQQELEEEKLRKTLSIKSSELEHVESAIQNERDASGVDVSPTQESIYAAKSEYGELIRQHEQEYSSMTSCLAKAFISATDVKQLIDHEICEMETFMSTI